MYLTNELWDVTFTVKIKEMFVQLIVKSCGIFRIIYCLISFVAEKPIDC